MMSISRPIVFRRGSLSLVSLGGFLASGGAAFGQSAPQSAPVGIPAQSTTQQGTPPAPTTKSTPTATSPAAATPVAAPAAPAAAPASWASTISLGLQFDAGGTINPERPSNGINYGNLFNDKANTLLLNQVQATATRPINSSATGYDVGFTVQFTYGTDARYLHYLGEFDDLTDSRYQLSLLQATFCSTRPG